MLRILVIAALAVVGSAFQAPVSVVARSAAAARYNSVAMVADEVEDKVRSRENTHRISSHVWGAVPPPHRGRAEGLR